MSASDRNGDSDNGWKKSLTEAETAGDLEKGQNNNYAVADIVGDPENDKQKNRTEAEIAADWILAVARTAAGRIQNMTDKYSLSIGVIIVFNIFIIC